MKLAKEGSAGHREKDSCSKNLGHLGVCLVLSMEVIAIRKLQQ